MYDNLLDKIILKLKYCEQITDEGLTHLMNCHILFLTNCHQISQKLINELIQKKKHLNN